MKLHSAIRRLLVCAFSLAAFSCSSGSSADSGSASQASPMLGSPASQASFELPSKTFTDLSDGSIRIDGHWVLKTSDPPLASSELPFGAQPLNSTIIDCSASTRTCNEYRATVVNRMLLTNDPLVFDVASWDPERLVASWSGAAMVECSLRVDRRSKQVEMEYRREPSAGRRRVFERWVLE